MVTQFKARTAKNQLSYAISGLREAVRQLRRTPDGLLDADIADLINTLENEIGRMKMLQDECKHYMKEAVK